MMSANANVLPAIGTVEHLRHIAGLAIPDEVVGLGGLCDFLAEHRIPESFAAVITDNSTYAETFKNPNKGKDTDYHLMVPGLLADVDSGILSRNGEYDGESVKVFGKRQVSSGIGIYDYGLIIPTLRGTHQVNTDDLPPFSWHARLWAPRHDVLSFNPKGEDGEPGDPRNLLVVVKDAARDLADVITYKRLITEQALAALATRE